MMREEEEDGGVDILSNGLLAERVSKRAHIGLNPITPAERLNIFVCKQCSDEDEHFSEHFSH